MKNKNNNKVKSVNNFDGLEPPKIYNSTPQRRNPNMQYNRDGKNISTAEKRHKQNKKRKLKNNVRKALITIGLIIVLLAVAVVLSLTVFFKITAINVNGSGIYTSDEVVAYSNIDIGDNLFLINSDDCAKSLEENLPYIYSVTVKRKLPSEITLNITEATPCYYIKNEDGSYKLLDDNLKVLKDSSKEIPADVKEIQSAAVTSSKEGQIIVFENENVSNCIIKLSEIINNLNMTEATALSSNGINDNFIVYENRITFKLGSCDNLESKVYRGLAVCEKLNETNENAKGTLDLTADKQSYFTAD